MSLRLQDALNENTVALDVEPFETKDELFRFMAGMLEKNGDILDKEDFIKALYHREEEASTYMGEEIAIPHGKSDAVRAPTIAFCRLREPMWYVSNDDEGDVKLVFMLAVPKKDAGDEYLRILATLSRLMVHEEFVEKIATASCHADLIKAFDEHSAKL